MMKISACVLAIASAALCMSTTTHAQQPVIPLYPGAAPGSEGAKQEEASLVDTDGALRVRNVTRPTLTAYLPERERANGTAVIVAPGGGFMHLAIATEGFEVAQWLQARGVAAFVLKYRLLDTGTEAEYRDLAAGMTRLTATNETPHATIELDPAQHKAIELAIDDGAQAVKLVRQQAAEWGVAIDRVGMMGFSAGGMLTMGLVMRNDPASRPDFAAPIYGGATNGTAVAADAPPLFIATAGDDPIAALSSAALYLDWKAGARSAELHIYSQGGHGFGMSKRGLPVDGWIERFGEWLQVQGLLDRDERM
ncbi:MAG TPA: alpha/beta hydrolase [Luteimonas sp.]|nr:alpha/beta hydrolase [Luteimonas sp.]HRO27883.1 alpha/beta hydrolase [Luteimonas sp.]HRP72149.1 alpha/beta hydrolase [Luteimonas sp.]